MGNASNSKFAICRVAQSTKDVENVTELVRYPVKYGSTFSISPSVDAYGDLVENQFENSRTDVLGAIVNGQVATASHPDFLALTLSGMLGTLISTNIASGQTFTAAITDICTAAAHGLEVGQRVKVSSTTTLPAGLSSGTVYYAGTLTANTFKLYTTYANAVNETSAVDITDTGTGTHTMTPEVYRHTITPSSSITPNFFTILHDDGTVNRKIVGAVPVEAAFGCGFEDKRMDMAVSYTAIRRDFNSSSLTYTFTAATTDICTASGHAFVTGYPVRLTTSGTLPAGLSLATTYYVGSVTTNTFKLYTTFEGAASELSTALVDITDTGSGTHTITGYATAFPAQEDINAFHFTRPGAVLKITVGNGAETTYTSTFAGFRYTLANMIDAEQRAGSNTFRVIEIADRAQTLELTMDYSDATFSDLIQRYQSDVRPQKLKIELQLRGRAIGQSDYFIMKGTFYNCHLADHGYTADPSIGKQLLRLAVNHDTAQAKSVQWEITNDIDSYLT